MNEPDVSMDGIHVDADIIVNRIMGLCVKMVVVVVVVVVVGSEIEGGRGLV